MRIKGEIDTAVQRVLAHGKYILGPEAGELEEKLTAYACAKYSITVANGTDALQIARIVPGRTYLTAIEAMADLYRTLPDHAGDNWLADSRAQPVGNETLASVSDPWST